MPASSEFRYEVDRDNRIVSVDDAWRGFASDNGWKELASNDVVGQDIARYVAGWDLVTLYGAIFDHVRKSGTPESIPFRCDSPTVKRYMELEIAPLPEGRLSLIGRLVRAIDHPYVPLLDLKRTRNGQWQIICSVCRRIKRDDDSWGEIEDSVENPYEVPASGLPRLTHGICEDCAAMMRRKAAASGAT